MLERHRKNAVQKERMINWDKVINKAWQEMILWKVLNKFNPESEEEIQSFLYYSFLKQLKSAINVKPKPTSCKPEKLYFNEGNLITGDMHFPDFLLGDNEVVIEIKFAKGDMKRKSTVFTKCKQDIEKMKKYHSDKKKYFILWDIENEYCFIDQYQLTVLQEIDAGCKILFYPESTNENILKVRSRKAVQTMKNNGIDFKVLGSKNAAKAIKKNNVN